MHKAGLYRQGFEDAIRGYNDPRMESERYIAGWTDGFLNWNKFITSTEDHSPVSRQDQDSESIEELCFDLQDPVFVPLGTPSPYRKRQQGPKSHCPLAAADLSDIEKTTNWEDDPIH